MVLSLRHQLLGWGGRRRRKVVVGLHQKHGFPGERPVFSGREKCGADGVLYLKEAEGFEGEKEEWVRNGVLCLPLSCKQNPWRQAAPLHSQQGERSGAAPPHPPHSVLFTPPSPRSDSPSVLSKGDRLRDEGGMANSVTQLTVKIPSCVFQTVF